jgi:hypothetical protein
MQRRAPCKPGSPVVRGRRSLHPDSRRGLVGAPEPEQVREQNRGRVRKQAQGRERGRGRGLLEAGIRVLGSAEWEEY